MLAFSHLMQVVLASTPPRTERTRTATARGSDPRDEGLPRHREAGSTQGPGRLCILAGDHHHSTCANGLARRPFPAGPQACLLRRRACHGNSDQAAVVGRSSTGRPRSSNVRWPGPRGETWHKEPSRPAGFFLTHRALASPRSKPVKHGEVRDCNFQRPPPGHPRGKPAESIQHTGDDEADLSACATCCDTSRRSVIGAYVSYSRSSILTRLFTSKPRILCLICQLGMTVRWPPVLASPSHLGSTSSSTSCVNPYPLATCPFLSGPAHSATAPKS